MDTKVKSSLIFLFLIFLILSIKSNIAFFSLMTLSLTTIFYNLNKGVSVYLLLGITGIYFATLVRNSVEKFQNNVTPTTTTEYTPTLQCTGDQSLQVSLKNFKELGFLFDALFKINENDMRTILREKCITDIFSLKNYIEYYRNQSDDEIETTNWAYSEKAHTLSKLIPIYLLTPEDMVILINREKVTYQNLESNKELRNSLFGIDSFVNLGMEYYFKEKTLNKKHYKIITSLGLDNLLPDSIKENLQNLLVNQRYYDYKIKDVIGLAILFEHFNYINARDLEEDYASGDENGDEFIKIKLIQIDTTTLQFTNNNLFKQYRIKEKIEEFLSEIDEAERERIARETIDFSQPFDEEDEKKKVFDAKNAIKDEKISEYHAELVEKMEDNEDDLVSDVTIDFNNVDKLIKKSNSTLTGVVDEILILYTNVSNTNYAPGSRLNNLATKYLVFVKELMNILTRDQRMLFVGLFIMILAIIFSLIEVNLY